MALARKEFYAHVGSCKAFLRILHIKDNVKKIQVDKATTCLICDKTREFVRTLRKCSREKI
jgi:hypothetical protein